DLRRRTSGTVQLPIPEWRLDILLGGRDLDDETSSLRRLQQRRPGLVVLPLERISIRPAIVGVISQSEEGLEQNRAWVRERVGYPPDAMATPNLTGTKIGVIEHLDSLTPHHPAFGHAVGHQGGQQS